jgi:hypothetical protein
MTAAPPSPPAPPAREDIHPAARPFLWLDSPRMPGRILAVVGLVCLALAGAEIVIHRHATFAAEATPLFYGIFGFASFSAVVLSGWLLHRWLGRPEDYYGEDEDA